MLWFGNYGMLLIWDTPPSTHHGAVEVTLTLSQRSIDRRLAKMDFLVFRGHSEK